LSQGQESVKFRYVESEQDVHQKNLLRTKWLCYSVVMGSRTFHNINKCLLHFIVVISIVVQDWKSWYNNMETSRSHVNTSLAEW